MYRGLGYSVTLTPASGNRGRDAILRKEGKKYLVECKCYALDRRVGRPEVQKFFAAVYDEHAVKGFLVTTADFSSPALEFARDKKLQLIPGSDLTALMRKGLRAFGAAHSYTVMCIECGDLVRFTLGEDAAQKACSSGHVVLDEIRLALRQPERRRLTMVCAKCGSNMRLKHGKYGEFWGCNAWPRCDGSKPYRRPLVGSESN
jgi:RNase P subunit RPR2